jgi:hypothetical protein
MLTAGRGRPRAHGQSTMEVLAGMGLTLILLAALYTFQQTQLKALAVQNVYSDSQNVTRSVVDLMTREIRMASYDPTGLALPTSLGPNCPGVKQGIVEATPNRIHFRQDLNGDGVIGAPGEDVIYDVLGTQLRRTDGAGAPVPIVDFATAANGLAFLYFDGSALPVQLVPTGLPAVLPAAQRDCVAKVQITVTANIPNPNPQISTPVQSVAETEVAIRNRSLLDF